MAYPLFLVANTVSFPVGMLVESRWKCRRRRRSWTSQALVAMLTTTESFSFWRRFQTNEIVDKYD